MELKLNIGEVELLKETLKNHISGMVLEIARTDHRDMREALKVKEELLESILKKLTESERKVA